jgi:hypothetical protein
MGWELRNGNWYYYRKHQINGISYSQYIGRGPIAERIAELDAQAKTDHQRRQEQHRYIMERLEQADRQFKRAINASHQRAANALRPQGLHEHRGEWRQRHDAIS